jgi:hypothetical protein
LFLQFHKLFLAHFDAFRDQFGYPPIEAWDPGTVLAPGSSVDHSSRGGFNSAEALPSWFKPAAYGNGTVERA